MSESKITSQFSSIQFRVVVILVAVLILPGIATMVDILKGPDTPRSEGIAKTPDIKLNLMSITRFPGDFRFYIKHRFGFKETLVTMSSVFKESIFGISPYTNVILGEDSFLFLGESEAIDYAQGVMLFEDEELERWNQVIQDNAKKIEIMGSKYELVLTPSKHTVYPGKLPSWVNVSAVKKTRADQLMSKARKFGLPIHDLRGALIQERGSSNLPVLYYKTDTHWNEYGAALGTNYLLSQVGLANHQEIQPKSSNTVRAGDLARMIGQQQILREVPWSLAFTDEPTCKYPNGQSFVRNQTDPIRLEKLHCTNKLAPDLKAVIFIDSFGVAMIPSFAAAFREVTVFWQYAIDYSVVEQIKPDFVIHQLTERKLQTLDPQKF